MCKPTKKGTTMSDSQAENNKAIVLDAFETLFNKRDYAAAERFWSSKYIQHSAHIGLNIAKLSYTATCRVPAGAKLHILF
jgi:hypothetical protein